MLTLEATQTLRGVAETADVLTVSVLGDESGGETDNDFKVLYQGQLGAATSTLYTTPASHATLIKGIHVRNTHTTLSKWFELFVGGVASANSIARFNIPPNGLAVYDGKWSIYDSDGQVGIVGLPGTNGANGSAWHEGTGTPAGGTGADGDFYLDDATGDVYEKTSGAWGIVANILGPQGDAGTTGSWVNVMDHGAIGDGTADDTDAIIAAVAEAATLAGGRGVVYFPSGYYLISETIEVPRHGMTLLGDGPYASNLKAAASFTGTELIHFYTTGSGITAAISVRDLMFRMEGNSTIDCIKFSQAGDQVELSNLWLMNVGKTKRGIAIVQDPDFPTEKSDTILMQHIHVMLADSSGATGTPIYIHQGQEVTMVGVKAVAQITNMTGNTAIGFHLVDPRGITMIGCSVASMHTGVKIENTTSSESIGHVAMFQMLWELVSDRLIYAEGVTTLLRDIHVRAPRFLTSDSATFELKRVFHSKFEVGQRDISLNSTCQYVTIECLFASQVTDNSAVNMHNAILSTADRTWTSNRVNILHDEIFLPASMGYAVSGTPALGLATNHQGWLLDAAATESAAWVTSLPRHWAGDTVDIAVYWVNAGAGSGDVRWNVDYRNDTINSALPGSGGAAASTATAAAQNVLTVTTLASGANLTTERTNLINVQRVGGNAADTLGNDILLIGVRLRRVP